MWRWTAGAVTFLALGGGCASPPPPYAEYDTTVAPTHLAQVTAEFQHTVILPRKVELQGPHPVDFYVGIALDRNPEILAARRAVAADGQVIPQVTSLDDPMLSNTIWPTSEHSPQTAMGRMPYALMISQPIPWYGKLQVRGEVAEQDVQMALARLAEAELKVVEDVRLAYFELYFNQRAIEITSESRGLLEDLLQIADARYRTGEASQQDVLRAQLELDRINQRLIELRQAYQETQADLASLLETDPDADLQSLADWERSSVPEEIDRLYALAIHCRPALQERLAEIVRERRREDLRRLDYYPDVTIGFGWDLMTRSQALAPTADGFDNFGLTVGMNLPIWHDKLRAGVGEAQHRTIESSRRYDATRNDTFRQIRRLMVQAQALDEQLTLFRESIIPRANQTFQVSIADYRVGRVSFLQLIDNWMQVLAFDVQFARLEANREQTLASLERAVGCALAQAEPTKITPANGARSDFRP